ncbi:MAG: DUF3293 domain-containing protein [Cyanobacteria bacterium J06632_3]
MHSSQPPLSQQQRLALDVAYQQTLYEIFVESQVISLRVNCPNSALDNLLQQYQHSCWAFVTAYNPYSQQLSVAENESNHAALEAEVKRLELLYFPAVGRDPAGAWPSEASVFVMGVERERAIALGNEFSQNAILYGTLSSPPHLIWLV